MIIKLTCNQKKAFINKIKIIINNNNNKNKIIRKIMDLDPPIENMKITKSLALKFYNNISIKYNNSYKYKSDEYIKKKNNIKSKKSNKNI